MKATMISQYQVIVIVRDADAPRRAGARLPAEGRQ